MPTRRAFLGLVPAALVAAQVKVTAEPTPAPKWRTDDERTLSYPRRWPVSVTGSATTLTAGQTFYWFDVDGIVTATRTG